MAYSGFAYMYDELNAAADYDRLADELVCALQENGILGGIAVDLGCGTGEVSLRLADAGYDMICVDGSEDMLSVFREKIAVRGGGNLLLSQQNIQKLDLYGTVQAAVSTFDTLNHLSPPQISEAIARIAVFIEKDGIFLFDANTPYKHRNVLANNIFVYEDGDFSCTWQNRYIPEYKPEQPATEITVRAQEGGEELFCERFMEYEYEEWFWDNLLSEAAMDLLWVKDGETFGKLTPKSQRYLFCAKKL